MTVIEKRIHTDGEPYYFNTETQEKYEEIVGGFAWPETEDGFLVVAAVDFFETIELEPRHIRVLAKSSGSGIGVFLKRALELQKHFSPLMKTIRFYGDTTSSTRMAFLDQFNKDRREERLDPFYLTEAPQLRSPGKLEFYGELIKRYARPGKGILHFHDTALPAYLRGLPSDKITKHVLEHPPVAALGYALAVLSSWRPRRGGKRPEDQESTSIST
jgi:hypothetical protein